MPKAPSFLINYGWTPIGDSQIIALAMPVPGEGTVSSGFCKRREMPESTNGRAKTSAEKCRL